jgi:uncharacterized BrkB/YihY/UPF0761 family membrane protein
MSFEDEYQAKKADQGKNKLKPFLPAIGFIIIGILALLSFVVSAPVHEFLIDRFGSQIPDEPEIQYLVAGGIFLVLLMFVAMLYSITAPKPPKMVTEKELDREKRERERERLEQKKRQRAMREKAARDRQRQSKK